MGLKWIGASGHCVYIESVLSKEDLLSYRKVSAPICDSYGKSDFRSRPAGGSRCVQCLRFDICLYRCPQQLYMWCRQEYWKMALPMCEGRFQTVSGLGLPDFYQEYSPHGYHRECSDFMEFLDNTSIARQFGFMIDACRSGAKYGPMRWGIALVCVRKSCSFSGYLACSHGVAVHHNLSSSMHANKVSTNNPPTHSFLNRVVLQLMLVDGQSLFDGCQGGIC